MNFSFELLAWLPWLDFYSEDVALQFLWVFLFLLFVTTNSVFYGVAYLFGLIFIWGLILAVYNLEVLTGFLLVVELTAVLVLILFLLALNFEGRRSSHATPMAWGYAILFASYAFFCHVFTRPQPFKLLNALGHWDDYYEALADRVSNDLAGLYICYYQVHSPLFIMFAFLIFFATLLCINLAAVSRAQVQHSAQPLRDVFNFIKDLVAFDFRRKQDTNQQQRRKAMTRFVKFGKSNVTEK